MASETWYGLHGEFPVKLAGERILFRALGPSQSMDSMHSMGPMGPWAHGMQGPHMGPMGPYVLLAPGNMGPLPVSEPSAIGSSLQKHAMSKSDVSLAEN
jgi:hypothetical protein